MAYVEHKLLHALFSEPVTDFLSSMWMKWSINLCIYDFVHLVILCTSVSMLHSSLLGNNEIFSQRFSTVAQGKGNLVLMQCLWTLVWRQFQKWR